MAVWRYDSDGALDLSFGTGGFRTFALSGRSAAATDVVVTPYARIVAVGWTGVLPDTRDVAVWELVRDGSIESFATQDGGAGGRRDDFASAILPGDRGGTSFIGSSQNRFGDYDMVVWHRR